MLPPLLNSAGPVTPSKHIELYQPCGPSRVAYWIHGAMKSFGGGMLLPPFELHQNLKPVSTAMSLLNEDGGKHLHGYVGGGWAVRKR